MSALAAATPAGQTAADLIALLLADRTGQAVAPSRAWRLETTLRPLLRERAMASLDELVAALVTARDGDLSERVVDALLNQESSFFRDAAAFDTLADAVPALRRPGRTLRIWSAGCSTGQEPLSVAMLLDERGVPADAVSIVATDVSAGAIARARAGEYGDFEIQRGLGMHRMMRWFDGGDGRWTASPSLMARIRHLRHNVVSDAPPAGPFDAILCRNVLLYLSPDLRAAAFARLAAAVRPGGVLMLGASETVIGQTDAFVPSTRWRGLYVRGGD